MFSCQYCDFDEDFPFHPRDQSKSESQKAQLIYDIIKSCYKTGFPPDEYRPRQPMLTRPVLTDMVVDAYLRVLSRKCVGVDGNAVTKISKICSLFYSNGGYTLMAPC